MKIGLLTQWFDPEPGPAALPGALARGLRDRGHDVTVLTGFPNYPTGELAPGFEIRRRQIERVDGITVVRVALHPAHGASALNRIANYASFGASAVVNGTPMLRGLDCLWVNGSPITVAWPLWAARFTLRIPAVTHVLDLWPDTFFASGFGDGHKLRTAHTFLNRWTNAMYNASEAVAYISPGVGPVLESRGVAKEKLHYIPMWADESVHGAAGTSQRAAWGIEEDDVVILYAGSLGTAQGLQGLIDAFARVADLPVHLVVAGSGVEEADLRARAAASGSDRVRFLGRVDPSDMPDLLASADIGFIGLRSHPSSEHTMPSKTQGLLAAGVPILAAAEGDLARLVSSRGFGRVADPDDATSIAAAIRDFVMLGRAERRRISERCRIGYAEEFSAAAGVDRIEALLGDAVRRDRK